VKSTDIHHFPLTFLTNITLDNHSGYCISLMWPSLSSFWVSSLMTCHLSSLNFLRHWRTGRTFGSMVRQWHRKSGSMLGLTAADHAKASMCRVMTSTIGSCASWPKDRPSLNFLPLISLSNTSPTGSGRFS